MNRRRSNSSSSSSSSVSICSSSSSSTVVDQGIRNDSVVDHHPTISTARATANNPKPMKNNKRGRDGKRRSCSSHEIADGSRPPTNSSKKRCSINVGASDSGILQNAAAPVTPSSDDNGGRGKSGSRGSGRSSVFRGVTRHRWTGRFEAHLWDKSWNSSRNKKGRQVYLGAYDNEEDAARTYDLAALKYWGPDTTLNFSLENYGREVEEMRDASREEYLASLRRRSSGFSRGVSKYRGVARHHHNGRWEARIGRVFGNKYLYLGTFSSQEEAAVAYDLAAIQHRGANAVTNFDISNYTASLKDIISSPHQLHRQNPNDVESKIPLHQRRREPPPRRERQRQQPPRCRNQLPAATADQTDSHRSPLSFGSSSAFSGIGVPKQEPCCFRNEGQDHPWTNFCLDVGYTTIDCGDPFLVPDVLVPLDMEEDDGHLLDLIGEMEFEENIDLIFQGDSVLDVDLGGILQRDNGNADSGVANVPNDVEDSNHIDELKFSSFSPSSSTINSMLCQF